MMNNKKFMVILKVWNSAIYTNCLY